MQKVSKRARGVFLVALLWGVIVVVSYGYIFYMISQENKVVAVLTAETARLFDERETLISLKGRVAETVSARGKLTDFFVPPDGVVPFLNQIQQLGKENKLTLKVSAVSVEDEETLPEKFEYLQLTTEVSGSWSDVYHFASLIELMPYKVKVSNINFVKNSTEAKKANKSNGLPALGDWSAVLRFGVLKLK